VATALSPCGGDVWPAALGGVVLRSPAASTAWRRRWWRPCYGSELRPRSAQIGLGGHGWACSRQQAAGGAWSAARRRSGADVLPGEGGCWIPSVQPRLVDQGGMVVNHPAPRWHLQLAFSPSVNPKVTPCSVFDGVGVDGRAG
jgi:hypothetical protein